ncbi:hypothetical protein F2Q69_00019656 [Brassica cretica]|uniref:Uncharacterized protein n=1 Tax=Brassica cretica TaxID=69181 RepID=A0A8S9QCV1_BRACR|nr:hypothetical protein F2Q69_00019656 [Brassica cretica]
MTIDADKDKQTHYGSSVNSNADRTPAGNVSTVTTNAVILDQMKEMFASAQKKSDEQRKLVASLLKQEKINVKFSKIIMKGDKIWKRPPRDESGPGKDNRDLQGRLGMTIDADKDKQTHDGTSVNSNGDRTPAGNVSTVTTNAVILDQMEEMFASAQKKSDEQRKLVASLLKQVETLTAKAKSKNPRGATRARSDKRLDFETPSNRATRADKDSSGQNPDETVSLGAQPTAENLPPPAGSNEGGDFEQIDLDISDQSDDSHGGADVHSRRT